MRSARLLVLTLLVAVAAPLLAEDINVGCEPGLRIYLDGKLVGVSNVEDGGLRVVDVPEGTHLLRIEKEGFSAQTFTVNIRDTPLQVDVGEFAPLPQFRPSETPIPSQDNGARGVGSLTILTAPRSCVVQLDGKPHTKEVPRLKLDGIAAGEHTISFSLPGETPMSAKVTVDPGSDITVRANLHQGEIKVVRGDEVEVVREGEVDAAPWGKGSLRVYSEPTYCTLQFMGKVIEKTSSVLNRSFLPAGDYPLVASHGGREVSGTITIKKGQRTIVTINFSDSVSPFAVTYEPE